MSSPVLRCAIRIIGVIAQRPVWADRPSIWLHVVTVVLNVDLKLEAQTFVGNPMLATWSILSVNLKSYRMHKMHNLLRLPVFCFIFDLSLVLRTNGLESFSKCPEYYIPKKVSVILIYAYIIFLKESSYVLNEY